MQRGTYHRRFVPLDQRFWERVEKTDTCWLWTGQRLAPNAYGVIKSKNRRLLTHRYSWELHNGPIPSGLYVCHHCDVKLCVNPAHLFIGTHRENMVDMWAKGLKLPMKAEEHPMAKLTWDDVNDIRRRYRSGHGPHQRVPKPDGAMSLALEFGITTATVKNILVGRLWRTA
jgi:hypothetical protein